ncbi:MAG: SPOR domain-containing protein [Bacteroidota bacterium]
MKKLLTILGLVISATSFSQITISAVLPSNISAGSSIDAEVKINKGTVGNFAKYQMDVPTGYIVTAVDVKGGNYTFENQRAKIVWVSVPSETEFALKLKIQANSDAASGTFSQKFYYLENNEKKEVEGNSTLVTVGGGSDVATTTPVETVKSTPVETVASTTPTETKPVETTNTTPVETVKSTLVETVKSTPPVETVKSTPVETVKSTPVVAKTTPAETAGMTFKVQLGAYSTQPNKSKFAGISNVSIDQINGYYKVTCGSFKTKEDAIKYRDELQSKGFNGFIVKYQNGQRLN